jgi:hypothetical protein
MTPRELEEYRALRATIRQRGTARFWLLLVGFGVWSALAVATAALLALPVATLLPLIFLATVFETIFALHTGIERVGRYVQVFYETDGTGWEHAAMSYGTLFKSGGMDALCSPLFWLAALLNLIPVALAGPLAVDWAVVGALHGLFGWRVWSARQQAGRQRAEDLDRFTRLRAQRNPSAAE